MLIAGEDFAEWPRIGRHQLPNEHAIAMSSKALGINLNDHPRLIVAAVENAGSRLGQYLADYAEAIDIQ